MQAHLSSRTLGCAALAVALVAILPGCKKKQNSKDTGQGDTADSVSIDTAPVENCGSQLGMDGAEGDVVEMGEVGEFDGGDVELDVDGGTMDVAMDTASSDTAGDSGPVDTGSLDSGAVDGGELGQVDSGLSAHVDALPGGFMFESEYRLRLTDFEFTQSSPGQAANGVIDQFLNQEKQYPIVVLLHLRDIDPDEGTARLRGGAGLKVDKKCIPENEDGCKYKWDPETPDRYTEIQLDPETGELTGGLNRLDFVGRTLFSSGKTKKFTLPIRDLFFTDAVLRPTGDGEVEIREGTLRGYITEDDAEEAKVQITEGSDPIPIASVLTSDLNYDSDDDGTLDAWCMEANFSAQRAEIVED